MKINKIKRAEAVRDIEDGFNNLVRFMYKNSKMTRIEIESGFISSTRASNKQRKMIFDYAAKILKRKPGDRELFGIIRAGNKLDKYAGRPVRLVAEVF